MTRTKLTSFWKKKLLMKKKLILHGFEVELNEGNNYAEIISIHPLFNAPLVDLVYNLSAELKRELFFIDIGAACGDTVLLIEERCPGAIREYLCVEGDAEFSMYLRKNMAQFQNVQIIQTMLAGESTYVNELVKHHKGTAACLGKEKVKALPLDDVLEEIKFIPDIIKIDVDGFDGEVIRGARKLLSINRPAVIFEWHPKLCTNAGQSCETHFKVLNECGYNRFLWFDNTGEFSHFSSSSDFNTITLTRDFLIKVNQRRDQHFDIIAFHETRNIDAIKIASLNYSKGILNK